MKFCLNCGSAADSVMEIFETNCTWCSPARTFTLDHKIAAIQRELGMRRKVYPARVNMRKMTQAEADHETGVMEAILADYQAQRPEQQMSLLAQEETRVYAAGVVWTADAIRRVFTAACQNAIQQTPEAEEDINFWKKMVTETCEAVVVTAKTAHRFIAAQGPGEYHDHVQPSLLE